MYLLRSTHPQITEVLASEKFDPHRWLKPYKNPDEPNWAGYDPDKWMGSIGTLYPTETA